MPTLFIHLDEKGKVFVWRDESEASPLKSSKNSNMFELSSHQDDYESFSYILDCVVGEKEDLGVIDNKVLAYQFTSAEQIFVISERRVDFYL